MNKFKNGWTMAELVVAMMVLAVLMMLSLQVLKPKKIKVIPFTYAAIKNLNVGAKSVLDVNRIEELTNDATDIPVANSNKSCVDIAEAFSLTGSYNCVNGTNTHPAIGKGNTGSPNFQTANLITYSGLEKDFVEKTRGDATRLNPCGTRPVGIKDIMIDIDGDEGENKVGVDQFPIKLFDTGEVVPGTCSNIASSSPIAGCSAADGNKTFEKHALCGTVTTKFINEDYPFAYTVYRIREVTPEEIASGRYRANQSVGEVLMINGKSMAEISFAKADCIARNNVLTRLQCKSLGYEPADECTRLGSYCIVRQSRPLSMNLFAVPF